MSLHKREELLYFVSAIIHFSLAHNELIAFQTMLKINQTSKSIKNIALSSKNISSITQEVTASTEEFNSQMYQLKDDSFKNIELMEQLKSSGETVKDIILRMTNNTQELVKQMKKINLISQNVEDIANQTNLLALNAAIEAAHAGESGRGFSVVANEVRKLSGQTKDAVKEVKNISDMINQKTTETKEAVDHVENMLNQYFINSEQIAVNIKKGTEMIEDAVKMIDQISYAMQEQAATLEETALITKEIADYSDFSNMVKEETAMIQQTILPFISNIEIKNTDSVINRIALELKKHADFLKDAIKKAGTDSKITNHTECSFGKWYHENEEKFKHIESFAALYEPHKKLHQKAAELANKVDVDHTNQLLIYSLEILQAFIQLVNHLNKNPLQEGNQ